MTPIPTFEAATRDKITSAGRILLYLLIKKHSKVWPNTLRKNTESII